MSREARRRVSGLPRARLTPPPRMSFTLELVPAHFPLERCFRCGNKIGLDKPNAEMWQRVEGSKLRYLHPECADERGEPLAPVSARRPQA